MANPLQQRLYTVLPGDNGVCLQGVCGGFPGDDALENNLGVQLHCEQ